MHRRAALRPRFRRLATCNACAPQRRAMTRCWVRAPLVRRARAAARRRRRRRARGAWTSDRAPGEVDPLGVPELVAHEAEPAVAAKRDRGRADHLVQRHAARDRRRRRLQRRHARVHLRAHQPPGCRAGARHFERRARAAPGPPPRRTHPNQQHAAAAGRERARAAGGAHAGKKRGVQAGRQAASRDGPAARAREPPQHAQVLLPAAAHAPHS